ncbi:MAG: hypothetical protein LBR41_03215 [Rickettsiales bacterium]|jgi:hypothetical protein|nr:hypothetical protein [Rickettsiales bacterium]
MIHLSAIGKNQKLKGKNMSSNIENGDIYISTENSMELYKLEELILHNEKKLRQAKWNHLFAIGWERKLAAARRDDAQHNLTLSKDAMAALWHKIKTDTPAQRLARGNARSSL